MKISIITPSYNSGDYIERAIESVLAQNCDDWEHLIIDGGSTDGTLNILQRYPHLRYISEPDGGQADAMNKGFRMSTGDIIVYLNADDYFFKGAFNAVLEEFSKGAKFVVGNVLVKSTRLNAEFLNIPRTTLRGMLRHWEPNAFSHNPVGYFYRKEVQEACPFNTENYSTMDIEFLLDAAAKFSFTKIEYTLGCFMDGLNTKTHQTQIQYDYWQPDTFPYINKHLSIFSSEQLLQYEHDRRAGYAQCQAESNSRRKTEDIQPRTKAVSPLISVIIPTYNTARYICRTVDSVLNQTVDNVEIIIVDDASTDNTVDLLREKYEQNRAVRCISHTPTQKKWTGAARNTGIRNATGDFIFFLDSDDWIDTNALKTLLEIALETDADVVACGVRKVWDSHSIENWHGKDFACQGGVEALHYYYMHYIGSIVWNKLYKNSLFTSSNLLFPEEYGHEDVLFTAQMANSCKHYVSISTPLINYYQRDNSTSYARPTQFRLATHLNLWKELDRFLHSLNIPNPGERQVIFERILQAHGSGELFHQIMRYIAETPQNEQKQEITAACLDIFGTHGYVIADALVPFFSHLKPSPMQQLSYDSPQIKRLKEILVKLKTKSTREIIAAVHKRLKAALHV